jgi:hypothetical protein
MDRCCAACGSSLEAFAVQCSCGVATPEATDAHSDPVCPPCALCGTAIALMDEACPACGAKGFPALRARRGKKSLGPPPRSV